MARSTWDPPWRPGTLRGDLLVDDPSEPCSEYPGRIRYTAAPAGFYEATVPDWSSYLDVALAWIEP